MKPAVDEMFPEGAGPYVDLDEVGKQYPERKCKQTALGTNRVAS